MPRKIRDIETYFWAKVHKTDTCWLWTGRKQTRPDHTEYGIIQFRANGKMNTVFVHRLSYQLAYGNPLPGFLVCHHCDNGLCVRPSHFFLGTHQDNIDDCVKKGRHAYGSRSGVARFNEEEIATMHRLFIAGTPKPEICTQFQLGRDQLNGILRGADWKHVYRQVRGL